jgi:hypothetical protein
MKLLSVVAMAGALIACAAYAQSSNMHDGKWEVTIPFPSKPIVADLEINGETGMFRTHFGGGKNNACGGKDTPVVVRSATPDELKLTLEYSKVLNGCRDLNLTARRTDEKTLKGRWPDAKNADLEAVFVKQ